MHETLSHEYLNDLYFFLSFLESQLQWGAECDLPKADTSGTSVKMCAWDRDAEKSW